MWLTMYLDSDPGWLLT